ncbi:MAG: DUF4105 domain-containing protein [Bacteroidetes bacterium]|nr:DUF4105 domain-containing protein [Bacteroidota bacterium]
MRFILSALFTLFCSLLSAQNVALLSDSARVSLMTVSPGSELYSIFGHSALRVYDPVTRINRVYNYGTFDFDQPNFYLNFCRGKLLYSLDVESYRNFEFGNLHDHRWMSEQVLNLSPAQCNRIFELLQTNALPENRDYKYDFFYDNCATRIRDLLKETFYHQISFDSSGLKPGVTMRQLLKPYLQNSPWTDFGIDLILGWAADRKARAEDYMFLPDHVHDIFAATKTDGHVPLVRSEHFIPENKMPTPGFHPGFLDRPFWVMCFFALLGLLSMANPRTERIFDTLFWLLLGLAGLVIALLWFATDHSATKTNLNMFWALPTHLLFFWRRNRSEFVEHYFTGTAILAALMLIFWAWIPQALPVAAIPVVVLVVVKGIWRRRGAA